MTPEATDIHLLVARALAGEQDAVEGVILAIQDDVYGLALRMLGERTAAEDATQEILLQVLTHLSHVLERRSRRLGPQPFIMADHVAMVGLDQACVIAVGPQHRSGVHDAVVVPGLEHTHAGWIVEQPGTTFLHRLRKRPRGARRVPELIHGIATRRPLQRVRQHAGQGLDPRGVGRQSRPRTTPDARVRTHVDPVPSPQRLLARPLLVGRTRKARHTLLLVALALREQRQHLRCRPLARVAQRRASNVGASAHARSSIARKSA
jgi:hypothetical protein